MAGIDSEFGHRSRTDPAAGIRQGSENDGNLVGGSLTISRFSGEGQVNEISQFIIPLILGEENLLYTGLRQKILSSYRGSILLERDRADPLCNGSPEGNVKNSWERGGSICNYYPCFATADYEMKIRLLSRFSGP
jgi:hypothetical protein